MKKSIVGFITLSVLLGACQKKDSSTVVVAAEEAKANTTGKGHEQGNGTDNVPSGFGTAWVIGETTPMTYCVAVAPDFGAESGTVTQTLQKAFGIWKQYFATKKINDRLEENFIQSALFMTEANSESARLLSEKSTLFRISLNSIFNPTCNGSENIKFYFGAEDDHIRELKKNYFNPTAFSSRTSYDPKSGIGHGVIWLVKQGELKDGKTGYPDWSLPNRILGVLLHEIGHVYGNGHITGTIMEEDMFGNLLNSSHSTEDQARIELNMSKIDHSRELFFPAWKDNTASYQGLMSGRYSVVGNKEYRTDSMQTEIDENFESLVGRKPEGEVISMYSGGKLTLKDNRSQSEFDLTLDQDGAVKLRKPIFSVGREWNQMLPLTIVGMGSGLHHSEETIIGEIRNKTGLALPVVVRVNIGFPLRITFVKDGKERGLLIMKY